jgi:hypothetical protein
MADDITIKVGVDGKAVPPALKQIEKEAEKTGKEVAKKTVDPTTRGLDRLRKAAGNLASDLQGKFMSFFAVTTLIDRGLQFVTNSFNELSKVNEQAIKIGIEPQDLQRIQYAAEQTGSSVEKLQMAFRNLRETVRDAKNGNADAIKVLQNLGYTQEQITSGNIGSMDMFKRLAGAVGAASTAQERFAAVSAVLGAKTAQDMIPLLSDPNLTRILAEAPVNTQRSIQNADRQADFMKRRTAQAKVVASTAVTEAPGAAISGFGLSPIIAIADAFERMQTSAAAAPPLTGEAAKSAAAGLAGIGAKAEETPAGRLPMAVSSLAAIGGGGNVYAGGLAADEMVTLASRTADASERSANALEKMANGPRGGSNTGVVTEE